MKRRNRKTFIQLLILRKAEELGQDTYGFSHREHRAKKEPSGKKRFFNKKREIIRKKIEEEHKELLKNL